MEDDWSYDRSKYQDKKGERWHFVWRSFRSENIPYKDCPVEIYFRNESKTYFGLIKFEHSKDNPYLFKKLVEKVIKDSQFRTKHESPESESIWNKNWK